jgi:hypothetical protein
LIYLIYDSAANEINAEHQHLYTIYPFHCLTLVFWPLSIIPANFTHSRSSKRKVFTIPTLIPTNVLSHTFTILP